MLFFLVFFFNGLVLRPLHERQWQPPDPVLLVFDPFDLKRRYPRRRRGGMWFTTWDGDFLRPGFYTVPMPSCILLRGRGPCSPGRSRTPSGWSETTQPTWLTKYLNELIDLGFWSSDLILLRRRRRRRRIEDPVLLLGIWKFRILSYQFFLFLKFFIYL